MEPPSLLVTREMRGYHAALDAAWEAESKQAKTLVAKTAEALRSKGLKVSTTVEQGDPESEIIDAASKWHADLIVVAAHGRKGLDRFLMGSVSEAVAQRSRDSFNHVRMDFQEIGRHRIRLRSKGDLRLRVQKALFLETGN